MSRNLFFEDCVTTKGGKSPNDSTQHNGHILIHFFRSKAWHITLNGQAHSVVDLESDLNVFEKEIKGKRVPEPVIGCFRQVERDKN